MALRYSKIGAEQYVLPIKTHTFNGSAQDLFVLNLDTFGQFDQAALVLNDTDLTGTLTVIAYGNTAANGSGTDTALLTMTLTTGSDRNLVLEVDSELLAHFEDRAAAGTRFKSLVFTVTGTNTNTTAACLVVKGLWQYDGRTVTNQETVT
jgi:hypothetical protein